MTTTTTTVVVVVVTMMMVFSVGVRMKDVRKITFFCAVVNPHQNY